MPLARAESGTLRKLDPDVPSEPKSAEKRRLASKRKLKTLFT
jgi:hypothetical protein